jgi:fatty acid/phospholipid biosynthesis enzyme
MAITNLGAALAAAAVIGGTYTPLNAANAAIGIGDSTAAVAATQTDLQATTNKYRQAMDTGFPTIASNVLTFQATVATANANFSWQEFGIFNSATLGSGTMFNRFLSAIGTKTSAQTWQLAITVTVTAA